MARFWEFQQLSDDWKHVSYFDKVPRVGETAGLYIGGLAALYKEPDPLKEAGVMHVLSILDFDIGDTKQLIGLKHLHIRLQDEPQENLIKHFEETNTFIDDGLKQGGVFVHCAMGVSRSATVVCAYLMWKHGLNRDEAVKQVREGRERIYPNHGFMEQLSLYEKVLKAGSRDEKEELVRRWSRGRYPPTKL
ncbi:Putative tyrosine-specific protein phosphatase [Septoria linicola]|uniref:protein-tyrosine-phosphatase n=1 Tax=Septoria linicola TaxID=215465 RepID=A0A9Q9AT84_9PEZI|nr:Putative tyrosine-specific protein phosphatase [Septoria linicola]